MMASPKAGHKTVLITGCTPGGIGHALCLQYHRQGHHVIATARRLEVLDGMAEMGMTTLPLDVTDESSVHACHAEVAKLTGGRLDILINNAGRVHTHPATDLDIPDVRQTFESNVFGVMAMVKGFIKLLVPARGLIINIASASAVSGYVFGSAYAASKAAVISYSRVLRLEVAPLGVRVMCVMAGTVQSNISTHGFRALPADSLYQQVKDIFEWRLNFSQQTKAMPAAQFATHLVEASLRPEYPVFLRAWLGRPDWLWYGGTSGIVWFTHSVGEWLNDTLCYKAFKVGDMKKVLLNDNERQKLK
ncbi:hypothetical protein DL771_008907 [Monosporascus sp. 5C6A]|nr:hypothetical protein DL771_008907 [Monosporascus sp. 5C6A]